MRFRSSCTEWKSYQVAEETNIFLVVRKKSLNALFSDLRSLKNFLHMDV